MRPYSVTSSLQRRKKKGGQAVTIESRAAFARRLGVARSTVTRAAQDGRLVLVGEEIDVEASLARYKAMALRYENQAIKLQMAMNRGRRHRLAAVKREALALGATLRSAIERLIDQTAPRLAVLPAAERQALLAAEIAPLRRLLRGEFPRALRRIRQESRS